MYRIRDVMVSAKKKIGIGVLILFIAFSLVIIVEIRPQMIAANEREQAILEEHKKWGLSEAMERLNCPFGKIAQQPNGMWECL